MAYVFLASPYSDPEPQAQSARFKLAESKTASLLQFGFMVFSPIVHCHAMAKNHTLPGHYTFWKNYSSSMLASSSGLLVLTIDGWVESKGTQAEIRLAQELNLPIEHIGMNDIPTRVGLV